MKVQGQVQEQEQEQEQGQEQLQSSKFVIHHSTFKNTHNTPVVPSRACPDKSGGQFFTRSFSALFFH
jgi:hypothetical protein